MMTGAVTGRLNPLLQLIVRGSGDVQKPINFLVDTGYSEYLSLPPRIIAELGLPLTEVGQLTLADGSIVASEIYDVVVRWDEAERTIKVNALEGDPLLGTALLFDFQLTIQFINGGMVKIVRLPQTGATP